ncbi:MAG: peptidoglycan-binding protein [Drouetiella hepatica Uher 2000/2452]|jgi:peptidoglycan hydrolase-like protein with peptidoglycan-binding domain|uniref:Peptidoglycan-binding protein n=1 Tax=Drouetiella hepatica Uher 2000/2452 TaxID=904376 RepID=A0A951QFU9_9CYAN|nr:peptidoglycan-binding protein [Drouetiella hepatica Uher 2000/2452]
MQVSHQAPQTQTPCHRMPVLRRNDQQTQPDEMVKFLQRRLNAYNFPLKIDGFFGAKTEAAVIGLQERGNDHDPSVVVDGIVGPRTWESLAACVIIREAN